MCGRWVCAICDPARGSLSLVLAKCRFRPFGDARPSKQFHVGVSLSFPNGWIVADDKGVSDMRFDVVMALNDEDDPAVIPVYEADARIKELFDQTRAAAAECFGKAASRLVTRAVARQQTWRLDRGEEVRVLRSSNRVSTVIGLTRILELTL